MALALGLHPADDPLEDVAVAADQRGGQPVERLDEPAQDDVLLRAEPGVHGARGDVGALGDLGDGGALEAALEDQLAGGPGDRLPRASVLSLAKSHVLVDHPRSIPQRRTTEKTYTKTRVCARVRPWLRLSRHSDASASAAAASCSLPGSPPSSSSAPSPCSG